MATPRYRIGNDLSVFWAIHNRDGSPFDMEGMEVHLYMTNERGRKEVDAILSKLDGETINNVIRWDYAGEDQRVLGLHSLTVEILESNSHREIVKDYCEAFELVSRSNEETEEGDANVSVRGDLILSSKLDIYRFEAASVDVGDLKVIINGIQKEVNDIGTELTTKASVNSVIEIGEQITVVQENVAEQTIKVDVLSVEIATKASTESVTQIAGGLNITNQTVAEQKIRTDGIEASIENLVTKETFNAATGEIANEFTSIKQTTDSIETTIQSQSGEIASIKGSVSGLSVGIGKVETELDSFKNQLDGVTESYFYDYSPSNTNEPAKTWIESGTEASHRGDTFTNTALEGEGAGKSWRWLQASDGSWSWHPIADTDAQKALLLASQAQAAADGKVTIFYQLPDKYKVGDIWFVHSDDYHPYKKGEILSSSETSTIFNLGHWESMTRYSKAVDDLNETMNTTFRDGVLDDAERKAIKDNLNNLYKDKQSVDGRYNTIVANADFNDTTLKNEFKAVKASYDSAYNSLAAIVEQIIAASTEGLKTLFASYENLMETYREAYAAYNTKETEVTEALMGRLNYASRYLDNITNDGVLTPIEKEQLYEIYRGIAKEYTATRNNAFNYKIWAYKVDGVTEEAGNNGGNGRYDLYVNLKNAYSPIVSAFNSSAWGFDKMDETTDLPSGYSTTQLKGYLDTYYSALGALSEAFSAITASIEEAQKNAEKTLVELTENLSPEEMLSLVGKGVVLSTIIATKDKDGNITAAMNASSALKDKSEDDHGRIIIAGGVKDLADWNNANFVLYEDGHADLRSVTVSGYASITKLELGLSKKVDIREYEQLLQVVNNLNSLFSPVYNNNGELVLIKANASFMARGYAAGATATADGGGGGIINKESIISALQYTPVNPADLGALAYLDGLSYSDVGVTKDVVTSLIGPATYAPYNASGYLPLGGGTINGIVELDSNLGSSSRIHFKNSRIGTSGYADNILSVMDADGAVYGRLGMFGDSNGVRYYYLGHESYDGNNLRVYTNRLTFGDSIVLHSGNVGDYAMRYYGSDMPSNLVNYVGYGKPDTGWGTLGPAMTFGYGAYYGQIQVDNNSETWYVRKHRDGVTTDWRTLIHSGNVGEYALKVNPTNVNLASDTNVAGYGQTADGWPVAGPVLLLSNSVGNYAMMLSGRNGVLRFNTRENGTLTGWKTIAFTDSNITGYAAGLKHSNGTVGAEVNSDGSIAFSGNLNIGTRAICGVSAKPIIQQGSDGRLFVGYGSSTLGYNTYLCGNEVHLRYSKDSYTGLILNSSGNVTIGASDMAFQSSKLYVDGNLRVGKTLIVEKSTAQYARMVIREEVATTNYIHIFAESNSGTTQRPLALQSGYGNVLIGTTTDNGAKLQVNGGISIASGYTLKIGDATISYVNGVLKVDKPFMAKGYAAGATATAN